MFRQQEAATKSTMHYLEAHGKLYRGFGECAPAIAWDADAARWQASTLPVPQPPGFSIRLSEAEAERCYPASTTTPPPAGIEVERDLTFEELVRFRPEIFENDLPPIMRYSPQECARRAHEMDELLSNRIHQG